MTQWIFGICAGLIGLIGAILAAGAMDIGMLTFGLGLIAFAVIYVFWLIKDNFDEQERLPG